MKKFFHDFKEFITKGNIMDMAVGVVVGTAFSKIVNSLVSDIIMPLVGILLGGINVTDWKWVISEAVYDNAGKLLREESALTYGNFIQVVLEFLIIAFSVFVALRAVMALQKRLEALAGKKAAEQAAEEKKAAEEQAAAAETTEEILKDIRQLLAQNKE